ncbi:MAG TPA: BTAD domain-containing putative transcriptional regulator [Longimicrobiales bacterium]|nr:BTAD domain-containing putative transcriptional regulator [Longimicrobiales bacterium]
MFELRALGALELRGARLPRNPAVLRQPKRMALLVYLALARPRGFHRRDKLLALFWPESDEERARHALRQAVYVLRCALGGRVIASRGDEELALAGGTFACDALEFESAVAEGALGRALALYRGDLLDGFHLSGAAPEFDQWVEEERARLRKLMVTAAWAQAEARRAEGDSEAAREWARRAVSLSPIDEEAQRRFLLLLRGLGDRVGAVAAYTAYARRLADEYELEPSAELAELARSMRTAPCT